MPASRLRIASGSLRGLPIFEPKGLRLRPTSGLVREAIFNIVGELIDGKAAVDLFAGTGALGLEALSHGASALTFVEAEAAGLPGPSSSRWPARIRPGLRRSFAVASPAS